jgi:hypothetical protein
MILAIVLMLAALGILYGMGWWEGGGRREFLEDRARRKAERLSKRA